eukprot:3955627-Prymnesium_polylepis.1
MCTDVGVGPGLTTSDASSGTTLVDNTRSPTTDQSARSTIGVHNAAQASLLRVQRSERRRGEVSTAFSGCSSTTFCASSSSRPSGFLTSLFA